MTERIAASLEADRVAQRSEYRWGWATIVCQVAISLGALWIAAAWMKVVLAGIRGQSVAWVIVFAAIQSLLGAAVVVAAWWGHRHAWSHAFPRGRAQATATTLISK
jgi:hypothetical protein